MILDWDYSHLAKKAAGPSELMRSDKQVLLSEVSHPCPSPNPLMLSLAPSHAPHHTGSPALLQSTVKVFFWPTKALVSPGPLATTLLASDENLGRAL